MANGIFTDADVFRVGFDIDPVCQKCLLSPDTIYHRCYSCIHIEPRARLALGDELYNKIINLGESSLLANRCMAPWPDFTTKPSDNTIFHSIGLNGPDDYFSPEDGPLFGDGSCYAPNNAQLARAGWAVVQVVSGRPGRSVGDPPGAPQEPPGGPGVAAPTEAPGGGRAGRSVGIPWGAPPEPLEHTFRVLKCLYGCVPARHAQNSLLAEHMAYWVGFENSRGCHFIGDCSDVLRSFSLGLDSSVGMDANHADLCKSVILRVGQNRWESSIVSVQKVKAHSTLDDTVAAGGSAQMFFGNQQADKYAKLGALLHDDTKQDTIAFARAKKDLINLASHMVDCLSGLGKERLARVGHLPRLPRGLTFPVDTDSDRMQHTFRWNGKYWICISCFLRTNDPLSLPSRRSFCKGQSFFESLIANPKGHRLWGARGVGGSPIIYCSLCWHYASSYPRALRHQCSRGDTTSRPSVKFYLQKGRHPIGRRAFGKPSRLH